MCKTTFRRGVWGVGYALLTVFASHSASGQILNESAKLLAADGAAIAAADRVPDGLSAPDWSRIRAVYEDNRQAVLNDEGGIRARNPAQRWWTSFDGRAFLIEPDSGGWSWGLELVSFGVEGAERPVDRPQGVRTVGRRVEYEWDQALTEWYVNDAPGLEHGYTLHHRPAILPGQGDQASRGVEPVCITLAVRGDLSARPRRGGRDVRFVNAEGAAVVNYRDLLVFDAGGATLPARFEPLAGGLRLTVDDRGARYPLTIDPLAQQAYLKASNTDANDRFGWSVAVSGDTAVVGALLEDSNAAGVNGNQGDNTAPDSGAVYVFVRDAGGIWSQQAYLKASNTGAGDEIGRSVAVSGDTVVVAAPREGSNATGVNGDQGNNSASASGAVYVFVRDAGGNWSQQAYLKASNSGANDLFGWSVAVSGDTVVVAARGEDSNATGINGEQGDNSASASGAAYVFARDAGGIWSQQAYLKASNTGVDDEFGELVAVSSDTVVVGARLEDSNATGVDGDQGDNTATDSGAAYVFVRDAGANWSQQAYLKASNTDAVDYFGYSVAVSSDTVVVGAYFEDGNATGVNGDQGDNSASGSGAGYLFVRDAGGNWTQQAYLKASNTGANDRFGFSVAVSGDTVVVGATFEKSNATGVNGDQGNNSASSAGAAYAFVRDAGGIWSQQAYLKASNTGAVDQFGLSVAVSGDTVVVGAFGESSNATGVNGAQGDNSALASGAAYVFVVEVSCDPPDCNGHGVCQDGTCLCDTGFTGVACDQCAPDYFDYPNCVFCEASTTCSGNGACNALGECVCDTGWTGPECATPLGTCCISNGSCEASGNCQENLTPSACQALGGNFLGANVPCSQACVNGACIPTVSTWGIVVLLLLVASAGAVVLSRGRLPIR